MGADAATAPSSRCGYLRRIQAASMPLQQAQRGTAARRPQGCCDAPRAAPGHTLAHMLPLSLTPTPTLSHTLSLSLSHSPVGAAEADHRAAARPRQRLELTNQLRVIW